MDLFDQSSADSLSRRAPLAERLRPKNLEEVVGQRHLTGEGGPLRAVVERGRVGSLVLWGPPGTGKTTLARVLANVAEDEFVPLSAVTSGVKDLRGALDGARERLKFEGRGTLLFVDEVHRFNKAQQDALLPALEEGLVDFIGATTENPSFEVTAPLLSRSRVLRLRPLSEEDLGALLDRGLEELGVSIADDGREYLLSLAHSPEPWLTPDMKDLLPGLRAEGHKNVLMVPVQFLADHLETLYDIDVGAREEAEEVGIGFHRIEMFNTASEFIRVLAEVVRREQGRSS